VWDPQQYRRFDAERSRPFFDLLAQVTIEPARVVDLGCGPGNLTATLTERWPGAIVIGIDSSPEMIAGAASLSIPGRLAFDLGDLSAWAPNEPVDLIVSNAALHWVPGHLGLLASFASHLRPGGVLAFQVPGNFREPSHMILHRLASSDTWRDKVGLDADRAAAADEPADYLAALLNAGLEANVWETTYLQVLAGADPVLQWMMGTALRPVLAQLDEHDAEAFCDEMRPLLAQAYPASEHGTVLPFRRIFAVARRTEA
jgi:trans-aconitate 2-methyltransferase